MDTFKQYILPHERREISIRRYSRRDAGSAVEALLREKCLGVSMVYAPGSEMEYLAVATPQEVVVVSLSDDNITFPNDESLCTLMSVKKPALAGFHMSRLSIRIYCRLKCHVQGTDLSTFRSKSPRKLSYPSTLLSKISSNKINAFAVDSLWNDKLDESLGENIRKVCLRAWISAIIIDKNTSAVALIKPVETRWLKREVLECLGHLLSQADILECAKPTEISNDFTDVNKDSNGKWQLYNSRFRTRVRDSRQLSILLTTSNGREFKGSPTKSHGKRTNINVSGPFRGKVTGVKVFGRERATNAEKARDMFLLRALQGECHIRQSKFVRMLWFPSNEDKKELVASGAQTSSVLVGKLNGSQREVVSAMISTRPLILVHGPPGTGKTSTISAAAEIWGQSGLPTWITAHSNVAVKNIAEKLASYDVDFKIIVSKEFYVEWHEHLYTNIEDRLLRGDLLPNNQKALRDIVGASTIILSTLSMISNSILDQNGMFDLVPPRTLVVDEASQINVFEYMASDNFILSQHVFVKFKDVMKKVCFFGDPKQLPPYGKEKAPLMQCIFDIDHLKDMAHTLDIQYRMPRPLGNFISREVYNNRLRSENNITDPSCIAFIDTKYGTEEKSGFSWRNVEEVQTVAQLVQHYYKGHDFCVITPYDAQRAAIEEGLKNQNLPWERRVFNVDSFQGN
ncbi:P-loop containing nucleoside triphosphate hydrolase protein [Armillaria borealis]|uniref:P-loop containing nucleoside triphosphate hydrolase protein n=1 Tax=Armillaria borealis TaxID=47425 RepID=A0AA39J3T2_9AGAR|nr:P-loop containing nucleoside triphosphate hydrolase protein [Armillaria borealis]